MMIYIAILPQFLDKHSSVTMQAAILSAIYIFWCALIYANIAFIVSSVGSRNGFSETRRRIVDGSAGGLMLVAAAYMATA
jgi:threonine/homoserine/homoserine lactone efflux protein